jgi:hypothetical protein
MERDVDQTSPSIAEVKNEWSCTSTPAYALIACTGTNWEKLSALVFRVEKLMYT